MNPYRTTEKQYKIENGIHKDLLEERLNSFYDSGYELFSILKQEPTTNPTWYTILLKRRA